MVNNPLIRLSELVSDVQQAFLSSRRASVHPERTPSFNSFPRSTDRKQSSFSSFHNGRRRSELWNLKIDLNVTQTVATWKLCYFALQKRRWIKMSRFIFSSQMTVLPWRENSSASGPCQPLRRFSSFQTKRRAFASLKSSRRYSYDTKFLNNISTSLVNGSPNSNVFARYFFAFTKKLIN